MEENVIQIKSGITINFDASVSNIIYVEKILFGILLDEVAKMENASVIDDLGNQTRMTSRTTKKQKQFQKTLMKKF